LIANNKGLSQKSLVLALLIATSGVALFIGIDTISNNNQAQAQQQGQTKINKVWGNTQQIEESRISTFMRLNKTPYSFPI